MKSFDRCDDNKGYRDQAKPYVGAENSYSEHDLPMVVVGKCMGGLAPCMGGREESYITFE